jgi:hypothetical protein
MSEAGEIFILSSQRTFMGRRAVVVGGGWYVVYDSTTGSNMFIAFIAWFLWFLFFGGGCVWYITFNLRKLFNHLISLSSC